MQGVHIQLEPLAECHIEGLVAAAAEDATLYRWSPVPQGIAAARKYVDTALAWKEASTAIPFAIVDVGSARVLGSTRYFNLERWLWPPGHASYGREHPDAAEIGYTWLARSATRTAANTEAKFLMLRHAFEEWKALRICLHTDVRNERSRAAMERIGAQFEGILRSHRMAADFIPRDSARYAVVRSEWPSVRKRLEGLLNRSPAPPS